MGKTNAQLLLLSAPFTLKGQGLCSKLLPFSFVTFISNKSSVGYATPIPVKLRKKYSAQCHSIANIAPNRNNLINATLGNVSMNATVNQTLLLELGKTSYKKECLLSGIAQLSSPPPSPLPSIRATWSSFSGRQKRCVVCMTEKLLMMITIVAMLIMVELKANND